MRLFRLFLAELLGTMILVLGGPGTAVFATGQFTPNGTVLALGVALAFGFALLVMVYAIGTISGCHINPAVTVGMWVAGKIKAVTVPVYLVGQVVGATLGALIIWGIASGRPGGFDPEPSNFSVNGWDQLSPGGFNFRAMVITEIVMTAVFVFVVLSSTRRGFATPLAGVAIGVTLALVHLVSIPIDNTSVNPARSSGMAFIAGGDALRQLWAFWVFPLIGGVVAALLWMALDARRLAAEDAELIDLREEEGARTDITARPTGARVTT